MRRNVRVIALGVSPVKPKTDSVSTVLGNVGLPTQSKPDRPRGHASVDCLLAREIPELTEHEVARERATVLLPKLVDDRAPKLAQPHG